MTSLLQGPTTLVTRPYILVKYMFLRPLYTQILNSFMRVFIFRVGDLYLSFGTLEEYTI